MNLLRRLGNGEGPMDGCFASAGRGLGVTLRSMEEYVSDVINRGICYIDNTLEDYDEEVYYKKKDAARKSRDAGVTSDTTKDDYQVIPQDDVNVRHRNTFETRDGVSSAEVWDISGESSSPLCSPGGLACAPLVDTDASPSEVYRLTAESSVVPAMDQDAPLKELETRPASDVPKEDDWFEESQSKCALSGAATLDVDLL